jgi:uncharacterized protein YoxC
MYTTLFLGLATLAFIVLVIAALYLIFDVRKAIISMRQFLETADRTLKVTSEEVTLTLRSVRDASDGVAAITSNVREVTGSARALGDNLKDVSAVVKGFSGELEGMSTLLSGRLRGLRAGAAAFLSVFQKGLLK